jgi:peptidoglycan/xylan/chitin deacetylase (PgdA/CDA1 family)
MSLTIVMYHYVRDLVRSRYPGIKGRTLDEFKRQLDHIAGRYTVVTAQQVVAAIRGEEPIPENAAWLTFDDGYLDHYTNVFPLLFERGWQGSFFPPSQTVLDGKLLDVNKIHFILAAQPQSDAIIREIKASLDMRSEDQACSHSNITGTNSRDRRGTTLPRWYSSNVLSSSGCRLGAHADRRSAV